MQMSFYNTYSLTLPIPYVSCSLDGTPTLNQWVLGEEGMASPSVITIECCGLLVGSTLEEIADHIKASWLTGAVSVLFTFVKSITYVL